MTSNLIGTLSSRVQAEPIVLGDSRAKVLIELGRCVSEHRTRTMLSMLAVDPSLARESVPVPRSGNQVRIEFPLACLEHEVAAGYLFAVQNGFDPNSRLQGGSTTLLQTAIALSTTSRSMAHHIDLLISVGGDPLKMVSNDCLHAAVDSAFAADATAKTEVLSMLLDAGADFSYSGQLESPLRILCRPHLWATSEDSMMAATMMARFVKSGVDINAATGSPRMVPMLTAIGLKNPTAAKALAMLGCSTDPALYHGREISQILEEAGLADHIPRIREAVMTATMSRVVNPSAVLTQQAISPTSLAAVASSVAPQSPAPRRRSANL